MLCSFRSSVFLCAMIGALMGGGGQTAMASVTYDYNVAFAVAYGYDIYPAFVYNSFHHIQDFGAGSGLGAYSASTSTPDFTEFYGTGKTDPHGSATTDLNATATSVTVSASVIPSNNSLERYGYTEAYGYSGFTVTEDSLFTITATIFDDTSYHYVRLYSPSSNSYLVLGDTAASGTYTYSGMLNAGQSYEFFFGVYTWNNALIAGPDYGNGAGSADLFISPSAVPEPSSLVLMAFGGLGLVFRAVRRRTLEV